MVGFYVIVTALIMVIGVITSLHIGSKLVNRSSDALSARTNITSITVPCVNNAAIDRRHDKSQIYCDEILKPPHLLKACLTVQ